MYKAIPVPIPTCGSEIWSITKKINRKQSTKMKSLRSAAGYTRKDEIRNIKIKKEPDI
jgi:hypothetical protein